MSSTDILDLLCKLSCCSQACTVPGRHKTWGSEVSGRKSVSGMGDVATQNLFALLGDEGEDPLADLSEAKPDKVEKKKPASAAPAEGRPGQIRARCSWRPAVYHGSLSVV